MAGVIGRHYRIVLRHVMEVERHDIGNAIILDPIMEVETALDLKWTPKYVMQTFVQVQLLCIAATNFRYGFINLISTTFSFLTR